MNLPTAPRARRRTAAGLCAFALSVLALSGCSDAPPATNGPNAPPTATNASKSTAPDATPTPAGEPAKPLAVTGTSWPGVEARLLRARPRSGLLVVEIQLTNTGGAPASIEHYSAADATAVTDVSKEVYGVFTPGGGQPAATTDLTQTLAPGESTTINAAFPVPSTAELATLTFPNLGLFSAIPLRQHPTSDASAADASQRAREKAENRARAMSGGRGAKNDKTGP